jgi:hypothetical protein
LSRLTRGTSLTSWIVCLLVQGATSASASASTCRKLLPHFRHIPLPFGLALLSCALVAPAAPYSWLPASLPRTCVRFGICVELQQSLLLLLLPVRFTARLLPNIILLFSRPTAPPSDTALTDSNNSTARRPSPRLSFRRSFAHDAPQLLLISQLELH